jgi:chaperonin GroEL (HSP60 family)
MHHFAENRLQGEASTTKELLAIAIELEHLALTSFGPHGRFKVLQSNEEGTGSFVVTTSSSKIFTSTNLGINSPGSRVLVELIGAQSRSCGDGGLLAMALAARLVHSSIMLDLPRHCILTALGTCLEWAEEYLLDEQCPCRIPLQWSDANALGALVRSIIGAKGVCRLQHKALHLLAAIVLEAFTSSIHEAQGGSLKSNVRFLPLLGPMPSESFALPRTVVLDLPLTPNSPMCLKGGVVVALFDISVQLPKTSFTLQANTSLEINEAGAAAATSEWSAREVEEGVLLELADRLVELGVGLVASQKLLHPVLQASLVRRGVMVVERLSIRHIAAVQAVSGARTMSSVVELSAGMTKCGDPTMPRGGSSAVTTAAGGGGSGSGSSRLSGTAAEHELSPDALGYISAAQEKLLVGSKKRHLLLVARGGSDDEADDDEDDDDEADDDEQHTRRKPTATTAAAASRSQCRRQAAQKTTPVCTVVVCHTDEAGLVELKAVLPAAITVLQRLLQLHVSGAGGKSGSAGVAVAGAGCTEVHVAAHLRSKADTMKMEADVWQQERRTARRADRLAARRRQSQKARERKGGIESGGSIGSGAARVQESCRSGGLARFGTMMLEYEPEDGDTNGSDSDSSMECTSSSSSSSSSDDEEGLEGGGVEREKGAKRGVQSNGGHAARARASAKTRMRARTMVLARHRAAVLHIAGCIEHVVSALGTSAAVVGARRGDTFGRMEAVQKLRDANQHTMPAEKNTELKADPTAASLLPPQCQQEGAMFGWDPTSNTGIQVVATAAGGQPHRVLDSLPVKLNAFKTAFETAMVLLRMRGAIASTA